MKKQFLKAKSVSSQTEAVYTSAAREFRVWSAKKGKKLGTSSEQDKAFEEYFDILFFDGHNPAKGRYALFGWAFVGNFTVNRGNFPRATRALRGWSATARERERWPMPWEVALAIAKWLADNKKLDSARALLLQFDTYLRPSELTCLTWDQITPPQKGLKTKMVWAIRVAPSDETEEGSSRDLKEAKTGKRRKIPSKTGFFDQTVLVGEPASAKAGRQIVVDLLSSWHRRRTGIDNEKVFDLGLVQYEKDVPAAVKALKLDALRLTAHTARHGGASADFFLEARTIDLIKERGRWGCDASVRRYKKSGVYAEQLARVPRKILLAASSNLGALARMLK